MVHASHRWSKIATGVTSSLPGHPNINRTLLATLIISSADQWSWLHFDHCSSPRLLALGQYQDCIRMTAGQRPSYRHKGQT
ncbi:hypothetical protein RRG08_046058 [Elysia crispata]|uniref:Uncharacterized protein n=1 Tax=Elysia crispata TaxID=231223 RepID=A0AAE1DUE0_9GAST|nr:hypothetical protein RRG08_046058 [Elysia crispata]